MSVLKNLDENRIESRLYEVLSEAYSGNIFCSSMPKDNHEMDDFVVISMNGASDPFLLSQGRVARASRVVLVQIHVKKIGNGFKNMTKMTQIRDLLMSKIPYSDEDYVFEYLNDIGSKENRESNTQYININCTIY